MKRYFGLNHFSHIFCALALVACGTDGALAEGGLEAHPHQGILPPYVGAPPAITLDNSEKDTIAQGRPIFKTFERPGSDSDGGSAVAVFRVKAPSKDIWWAIRNFEKYPEWIPGGVLEKVNVYKKDKTEIGASFTIYPSWVLGRYTYHIRHNYPISNERSWGSWTLDYSKKSDFNDMIGFWQITPVEGKNNECDVFYSLDIKLFGWVPGIVKHYVVTKGLEDATYWLKQQAENKFNSN